MDEPILKFESVTVDPGPGHESGAWQVDFSLMPGELLLVRLEKSAVRLPLADAAQGLVEPSSGQVYYEGVAWAARSWDAASAARGSIGRVFADGGWVRDLDIETNITLAQRHHTRRPVREIRDEAAALARVFSLPGLLRSFPYKARRQDLLASACVRAFLGHPRLVILEWTFANAATGDILAPLMSVIRAALRRKAAVLWLTDDVSIWSDMGITSARRATMSGSQFIVTSAAARTS